MKKYNVVYVYKRYLFSKGLIDSLYDLMNYVSVK